MSVSSFIFSFSVCKISVSLSFSMWPVSRDCRGHCQGQETNLIMNIDLVDNNHQNPLLICPNY